MVDLWNFQKTGVAWLRERDYGFLGMEMGCGKTATTLRACEESRLVLVVCPIAVGNAWLRESARWCPQRQTCLAVSGSTASRAARVSAATGDAILVVVNYEAVHRGALAKIILSTPWDAIVLDESHKIKSPAGRASRWLAKLAAKYPHAKRICLSGTPTPNNPLDWWGQFRFLDAKLLGPSFPAFRSRIAMCHSQYPGWVLGFRPDALADLSRMIDPHVFRVTAAEVLDLPDTIHSRIDVELGDVSRAYYDTLESDMVALLGGGVVTAANKLVVSLRLQMATSGHAKLDSGETVAIAGEKTAAFSEWLSNLPAREPLVVFCRFIPDIDAVHATCRASGRTTSEVSGRVKQLEQWQNGQTDVVIVQQQAGGLGIDLTRSSVAVYYSISHSLGDYEQSLARLHRPGQKHCVRYFHLVAIDTIDEAVYEALEDKRDVVESILARLTRRTNNG